jgi:hypothetical protein
MAQEHNSGIVTIEDNIVTWCNQELVVSKFDLDDVVVIGECTNSDGPWFDDWFIAFVLKNSEWQFIPFYASNIDELLKVLSQRFDQSLALGTLANSTNWNSVVRYPKSIAGKQLFTSTSEYKVSKSRSLFQNALDKLGIDSSNISAFIDLSDDVKSEIQEGLRLT